MYSNSFKITFCFFLIFSLANLQAQSFIAGKVQNKEGEAIPFSNIFLAENNQIGTVSDEQGNFELEVPEGEHTLVVSAIGFDQLQEKITIQSGERIDLDLEIEESSFVLEQEVVVSGTMREASKLDSPVPVESYPLLFLQKNPTSNLYDALQIVNGVRPQLNCQVCSTGDIHINGLEGAYTMVLIDGMPIVSGLSTVYGLMGIPNSMIDRVEIVKGPAAVLYGSESMAGVINVITKNPIDAPIFSIDLMGTDWQEYNLDVSSKFKVGKTQSLLGVNYFHYDNPIDNNNDGFTDIANLKRISIFNKWTFPRNENRIASIAGRFVYEDRWGGQMNWTPEFRGGEEIYGESIYTTRWELIGRYQLPIYDENVMLSFSFNQHLQDSYYGADFYDADQRIGFGQLTWDKDLGQHNLLVGATLRYNYYDDNTPATRIGDEITGVNQPDEIWLPGFFIQNEINLGAHTLLLAGRYDYNADHGHILTPRFNWKWSPNRFHTLRLSAGTGFRVVNLFTEDHAATTGAREVVLEEDLNPEQSWNINLNYQGYSNIGVGLLGIDASVFYTRFFNQIIPDYDSNPNQIIYDNLDGYSVSRGVSLNLDVTFNFPLTLSAGVTVLDVFKMENDENGVLQKSRIPLTEQFNGAFTASYTFTRPQITVDYSGNIYGPMDLSDLLLSDLDTRSAESPTFSIQNIKISKQFNNGFNIYGGIKNIWNFTPPGNSIARANDPFDQNVLFDIDGNALATPNNPEALTFDPSYVYAAFQGIRGFLGVSYSF